MWASFGAGKTHALMNLRRLAQETSSLVPLYVVTPRGIKTFVDLYRAVSQAALESGVAASTGRKILLQEGAPAGDVERALRVLASGDNEQAQAATSWLRAERLSARERQSLGLSGNIDSTNAAIESLQHLIHAIQQDDRQVLLLVDEVQELAELGKKLDECIGGLHKLFDKSPTGLTLVLSFTTATQGTVRSILGETLWDRVGQTIELPAFTREEGADFLTGLITANASDAETALRIFSRQAMQEIVDSRMASDGTLTPRSLIRAADQVLREALTDLEDGLIAVIDAAFVREVLGGAPE
ncbi:BREX system ATP-binding domain-containing protein [Oryzobacter sp. 24SJ04S-52]|uniref:BREX system ATP-binding domain-containing protein n=1 Tax=Oryzobacter telluris TaxID=3149179 RepID=UPI00370D6E6F